MGFNGKYIGGASISMVLGHAGGVSCGPALGLWNENHPSFQFDLVRKAQLKLLAGLGQGY